MADFTSTLSLGGGILHFKFDYENPGWEDFGYTEDFTLLVSGEDEMDESYMDDGFGNLIKVLQATGKLTSFEMKGNFEIESFSRDLLQKIWFRGENVDTGTELFERLGMAPMIMALRFLSVPAVGPAMCLLLPAVRMSANSDTPLMGQTWASMSFEFMPVFAENMITVPTLRVQEEGETLLNFCT